MDSSGSREVLVVLGTRPEAIKLAPVVLALRSAGGLAPRVLLTGQHQDLVPPVLDLFGLRADVAIPDDPSRDEGLAPLLGHVVSGAAAVLRQRRPALVLVQGDTSSALAAGLAAFYGDVPLGHVEAGLRTGHPRDPFPEEVHRRALALLADLHFAPTEGNRARLLAEGIPPERIHVTGNTVVDSVLAIRDRVLAGACALPPWIRRPAGKRRVTVTLHRRESWDRIGSLCGGLRTFARRHPDWEVLLPVHPNPAVAMTVGETLGGHPGIRLTDPLRYDAFVAAMMESDLVVTDSGGVQEEAPVLGLPILVVRDVTERSELLDLPGALMTERDPDRLLEAMERAVAHPDRPPAASPFGDGRASARIAGHVQAFLAVPDGARVPVPSAEAAP